MTWHKALSFGLVGAIVVAACGGGCAASRENSFGAPQKDAGGAGSDGGSGGDGPSLFGGEGGQGQAITIQPGNATLDATGSTSTLQFTAVANGQPVPATWTIDLGQLGTISSTGLFTASGAQGGTTTVHASYDGAQADTNLTVVLHLSDNPGSVTPAQQTTLQGGQSGAGDPAFKWLYPYDGTVFPRGLLPPTLQFAGTAPDAALVQVTCAGLQYQGFYTGATNQVLFTPALWQAITETANGTETVQVSITKLSGGVVAGPITQGWKIAQGSLAGTLYYNTYSSPAAGNVGAVMRVKPGASTPDVLIGMNGSAGDSGQCTVCHAVSADGSTLVASHSDYTSGASWDLTQPTTPVLHEQTDSEMSFGGLYPNGSFLMTNGALSGSWPPNVPGQTEGPRASHLIDTKTGVAIPAPGFDGVITYAITPVFSQDGKHMAFNHYDTGAGHSLAVMDFDVTTHTFSNLRDVATDPAKYLAWPAFTPDGEYVFYHSDDQQDYATWEGAMADIMVAHIASGTTARLDELDGYKAGQLYLPYGTSEATLNFEPTVLPVAVGGYYWMVFTSRREYGNLITGTSPDDQPRKKLWIAAIDIDSAMNPATMAADISHPAFYLDGQELAAGNMRGFWALDPCAQNGTSCTSGDQCCTGYCRQGTGSDGGSELTCVPPQTGCSNEFEHCNTTSDCCQASQGYQCINNYCAQPTPN